MSWIFRVVQGGTKAEVQVLQEEGQMGPCRTFAKQYPLSTPIGTPAPPSASQGAWVRGIYMERGDAATQAI